MKNNKKIELLAPAKDKETAFAAINSGADAVYIGAVRFGARQNASNSLDDIKEIDNKILVDQMYDLMDERQKDILDYTYRGYKQQEVGEILDISQSRVSVIKKKALVMLKDFVTIDDIR